MSSLSDEIEWMFPMVIYGKEVLEWRKAERLAGRLNPMHKGVRGLKNAIEKMRGRETHSLGCRCEACAPQG